jgi:hypothetical protein
MKLSDNNRYLQNFKNLPEIKVGEIRRLVDMELRNESRLVVIVSINRADESAEVVLINNMLEIATPRDILLSTQLTGAPFELVLLPDFTTRVWKQQLDSSPVFGNLDENEINVWINENNSENIIKANNSDLRGIYLPEFADHVWLFRGKEIDALNSLGHFFDILNSNQRFNEIWREPNKAMQLTDIILENNLDISLLDNFFSIDAIRLELV